ncbi:MAG: NAD-dependent deacetylase, partial [Candidatus Neomarinimicrobiota bacterium]
PRPISLADYQMIVFFTGAGMSAESGVPTYRGRGGIWAKYNWEEVACEEAFRRSPEQVLEFHALRRQQLAACLPHRGHYVIANLEASHPQVTVITQNIDGLHQRAGSKRIIELHGSLWRLRCSAEGTILHLEPGDESPTHCQCGAWMRPDIVWFGDYLDPEVLNQATEAVSQCDLLVAVGTSAFVWPAAGFPQLARDQGTHCIEINPEATEMSRLYHDVYRSPAGEVLPVLFPGLTPA